MVACAAYANEPLPYLNTIIKVMILSLILQLVICLDVRNLPGRAQRFQSRLVIQLTKDRHRLHHRPKTLQCLKVSEYFTYISHR